MKHSYLYTLTVGAGLVLSRALLYTWHALLLTVLFPLLVIYRVGEAHMDRPSSLWLDKLDPDQAFRCQMVPLVCWGISALVGILMIPSPASLFEVHVECSSTIDLGLPPGGYFTVPVELAEDPEFVDALELPMSDAAEAYAADAYAEGFHDGIWAGQRVCESDYDDGYRDGRAVGSEEGYHDGLIEASVCPRPHESETQRE